VQIVPGYIAAGPLPTEGTLLNQFLTFKRTAKRLDTTNCMTHVLTLGRSVSFITAVMCEMLRAYTVRSLRPAWEVWNRTWVMHFACLSSFLLTVSLTFIPGVKLLFKLDMPMWFYYGIAFLFALGSMTIDEISKFAYRGVLARREAGDKGAAERKEIKDRVDIVVERMHELERGLEQKADATRLAVDEIKVAIADLAPTTGRI